MIQILGADNTREYTAAVSLRDMLLKAWPTVEHDPNHEVWLVAGAKCHGQRVRDVDVLLLASFGPGLTYRTFHPFRGPDGQPVSQVVVEVRNLCLAIEVKDHRPEDVQFFGTAVEVKYKGQWHNASEQNESQAFSVKAYLNYHRIAPPWVTALLWLRQMPVWSLPARPHPILGAQLTWDLLLNVVAQLFPPRRKDGGWVLDAAGTANVSLPRAADLFTKRIEPTALDRMRMERINEQSADLASIRKSVGSKMVILRGQGGTGKTMRLLQIARQLAADEGERVLILTYNKALVADIRRLLAILGIDAAVDAGGISVLTVHSFIYSALVALEVIEPGASDFLKDYERLKDTALSYLRSGAVSSSDINALGRTHVEAFRWDYVFVDEGQDWPSNERDLLRYFYPFTELVIADGVSQLVRRGTPLNWREGLAHSQYEVFPLKKSLRMKAGLARFVTAVARHLGLPGHEWLPNEEVPGGRVIIVDRPYLQDRALHERLMQDNVASGNLPVDMLFCVPPSLVNHNVVTSIARSSAASVFEAWGFHTWDGASEDVRESYPTDTNQIRIVQYESCRGLEGWIAVHLGLDLFYKLKLHTASNQKGGDNLSNQDVAHAHRDAARWLMIPLTRAMDTLVIQLDLRESPFRSALEAAAEECQDYVEWVPAT